MADNIHPSTSPKEIEGKKCQAGALDALVGVDASWMFIYGQVDNVEKERTVSRQVVSR